MVGDRLERGVRLRLLVDYSYLFNIIILLLIDTFVSAKMSLLVLTYFYKQRLMTHYSVNMNRSPE